MTLFPPFSFDHLEILLFYTAFSNTNISIYNLNVSIYSFSTFNGFLMKIGRQFFYVLFKLSEAVELIYRPMSGPPCPTLHALYRFYLMAATLPNGQICGELHQLYILVTLCSLHPFPQPDHLNW